ncbi:MAG: T9SS type A sorting domain-containing protein, partial [Flavobacteriales bacterium]|nr:T9SS type A sorting domain-containing protein [Flavobacteriales bacterium]
GDGAPTYEISVDPPPCGMTNPIFTGVTSGETVTITGLLAGAHAITVEDVNNCTDVYNNITLEPALLEVSIASTDPSCVGCSDGVISAIATGGTSVYTYIWNDMGTQTTATATTLPEGAYCVVVTDGNGCTYTACETLTDPPTSVRDLNGKVASIKANGRDIVIRSNGGKAEVYNTAGQKVYSSTLTRGENRFTLNQRGMYIVRVSSEGKSTTRKVLLN